MTVDKEEFLQRRRKYHSIQGEKSKLRQYSSKKPKKWGCKLYMICTGKFGLIGTSLYAGKQTVLGESSDNDMPKSSPVVRELAKALSDNKNFKLAFDN